MEPKLSDRIQVPDYQIKSFNYHSTRTPLLTARVRLANYSRGEWHFITIDPCPVVSANLTHRGRWTRQPMNESPCDSLAKDVVRRENRSAKSCCNVQLRKGGTGTEVEPVGSAGQMTNWPGDSHFISFPFG
jgi:hypothetical protein